MRTLRRYTTSNGPIRGKAVARLHSAAGTKRLSAGATSHALPARVKWRTSIGAGRPRLTSSWLKRPARVRSTISRERSVAVIETRVAALGSASSSSIASVYGSWPLEHAADQIFSGSTGPRALTSAGSTVEVRAVNGSPSRNHEVSLVVSASTIRRLASGSGRVRTVSTRLPTSGRPIWRAIGSSRASTRYSLPGWRTIALSLCTSWRTQSKLVVARVIEFLRRWQERRRRGQRRTGGGGWPRRRGPAPGP